MVMEVVHEDIGEDSMHCINHPYKNSTPGGICAFCLQEKLGKLVSSSYPSSVFPSSSSSSSTHSSRSAFNGGATTSAAVPQPQNLAFSSQRNGLYTRKPRLMPFVLTHKKKKIIKDGAMNGSDSIVFKRSKSTATPSRRGKHNNNINFLDENYSYSPSKRGFWSFLYSSKHSTPKKSSKDLSFNTPTHSTASTAVGSSSSVVRKREDDEFVGVDDNNCISPKVSRSRSVGCGSRSFSGDFFERISTGFGDCTLRRVESQREGGNNKPKVQQQVQRNGIKNVQDYCIKERVKCGGIFSGFMIASAEESNNNNVSHNIKSKSWVWAFASPMRAFGKPSNVKRDANNNDNNNNNNSSSKNESPNLDAIPSLLAVKS
ncbi:hypothetical protein CASFOL_012731 [Castilleja foliolosa]|uniref:Uncharacterized protein n=1 Tax=Castilleja foliolosa TaxID=1961234 RepID=A0ABD3DHX4_9LAMI